MVYLDYAAATPLSKKALQAMMPYLTTDFYNPSALYWEATKLNREKEQFRAKVASVLGAKPVEVIFLSGGSEANNLAIKGLMDAHPGSNITTSAIEHKSVLVPARQYQHKILQVDAKGRININSLLSLIDDSTVLISIILASNEVGVIQPLAKVREIINQVREERLKQGNQLPLYLHTDASQAGNYLSLAVTRLGVDLMTVNGGKIYGPKQSGILYVKSGIKLNAQITGGGQELGSRAGTESLANIAGFSVALDEAQQKRANQFKKAKKLQLSLINQLKQNPKITFNGDYKTRLPNNVNITISGVDGERLVMELDNLGFMVATGTACTASDDEPSYVLQAMGISKQDAASSLRITIGRQTTEDEISEFARTLLNLIETSELIWV